MENKKMTMPQKGHAAENFTQAKKAPTWTELEKFQIQQDALKNSSGSRTGTNFLRGALRAGSWRG